MYYVYLLRSLKSNLVYVGSTSDLKRRFKQHNNKENISTRLHVPFRLIYYESYRNKLDALQREKMLKHHGSIVGHLKKRISRSLNE